MIRDPDLNDLKNGLKTYFTYDPLGPKTLQLNYDMACKLLNLLENLDELCVDNLFDKKELELFPFSDLEKCVKSSMVSKIADKLEKDGYVEFTTTEDRDLFAQRFQASVIVLKRNVEGIKT